MRKLYVLFFIYFISNNVLAQDPQFTQFYAAPLYLNPAFAGANPGSRAIVNGRVQWANLPKPFQTYAASFDHNIEKLRSGVGIFAMIDKAGTGALRRTWVSGMYSYQAQINSRWVVRPAIQFTYGSNSLDYYKLTFGDQLDLNGVNGIVTSETFENNNQVHYFDFSSGVLAYSNKFWIGLAAHHLNRPDQTLNDGESYIPVKYSLHGGMKIDMNNSIYKSHGKIREKSITPAFLYRMQGKYDQLDLGLYYHYEPLVIGLWYRGIPLLKRYEPGYGNNDALAVLIGIKQDNFTVGYSYDLTLSRLGAGNTGGSHEISLSYSIDGSRNGKYRKRPKMRKKDMVIPCPKF